jgi:hypothetical protein
MKHLLIILLLAAQAAPQPATGNIEGTVLNSVTMTPLANAQITVSGLPAQINLFSDQTGRFLIPNVPAGTYFIGVMMDGFFGPELNGASPAGAVTGVIVTGGQTRRIPIPMAPGGTISGTIFDAEGVPVVDARVQVLRVTYADGIPIVGNAGTQTTDDQGNYRIFGLRPGEYYVAATPKLNSAGIVTRDAVSNASLPVRTLFPNAVDLSQASVIRLHAGEEISGIRFSFQKAIPIRISGQVISTMSSVPGRDVTPAIPNAILSLLLHDKSALDANTEINHGVSMGSPNNGHFEIANVLPGVYDLFASLPDVNGYGPLQPPGKAAQPVAYGRITIDLHSGDREDITVAVHHGIDIQGRVTIDGGPSLSINNVRVSLQPDDSASNLAVYQQVGQYQPRLDGDGSFTIPAVPEAQYRIRVAFGPLPLLPRSAIPSATSPSATPASSLPTSPLTGAPLGTNGYVDDILQSGKTVYDNGIYVGNHAVEPLEVRVRTDGGSVEGVVMDAKRNPYAGATVVLVPPIQHRQNPALFKVATSDAAGRFSMTGIRPGEYKLLAWDSIPTGAYMNAAVLDSYKEVQVSVNVPANIHVETQLNLILSPR